MTRTPNNLTANSSLVSKLALLIVAGGLPANGQPAVAQQIRSATTVRLTSDVRVSDTMRLGLNLGGDNYYSGAALVKMRTRENFEGTMYRRCDYGPGHDAQGVATWFSPSDSWRELIEGGLFTILSGPSQWQTGIVRDIESRQYKHQGDLKPFTYYRLSKPIEPLSENSTLGIMLERNRTRDGQMRRPDGYWCSRDNEIEIGDVPPGSFGCAALQLKSDGGKKAHYRFATHYQRYGETNGTWHVRFWAKTRSGDPSLVIRADRDWGERCKVIPAAQWKRFDQTIVVDKAPEPQGPEDNPHLLFVFEATGGAVMVDDVEIWMEGDSNPTAFRDDVVRMLKRFRPGVLRKLQMGGSTIENTIRPPLQSFAYSSQPGAKVGPYASHSKDPYSLHQMYELCEYIGCDPWFCLPGTMNRDEMKMFMEYLGAPSDVGGGKLRAELGHPRPWTEVFERIHLEFGNEAWNNAGPYQCGGFNGPGYWASLFRTGRESPYFSTKIVFHAGGQAANSWLNRRIMTDVPNADYLSVAPYIIQGFEHEEYEQHYDTPEKLFRWAFAWPWYRSHNENGAMFQNAELAERANVELSVYEVNHHTTHGTGPLEPRNELVTSIGGGLNVVNTMLMMLKEHGVRTQALFSLVQHGYQARGIGTVRLWGTALCMRQGHERYRPTFLACAAANKVMGGDLVVTRHAGANPTFSATGVFRRREAAETIENLPAIWSYGFRDGTRHGLILLNLDVRAAHDVRVEFEGQAAEGGARSWTLTADHITDNNEYETGAPQVALRESRIAGFTSGQLVPLPPFSMTAISWETASR
jgi:hypothetical protein